MTADRNPGQVIAGNDITGRVAVIKGQNAQGFQNEWLVANLWFETEAEALAWANEWVWEA